VVQPACVECIYERLLSCILPDQPCGITRVRRTFKALWLWREIITHAGGLAGIGVV
jgi:hypothetical protein